MAALDLYSPTLDISFPGGGGGGGSDFTGQATISAAAGVAKFLKFGNSTTIPRWWIGANSSAESGSDVGTDFEIRRYSDANALLSTPITIQRSTGFIGVESAVPTHSLTLGSVATGIAYYGTSDQTTNYERLVLKYVSSNPTLTTEAAGTGTNRNLVLIGGSSSTIELRSTTSPAISMYRNFTALDLVRVTSTQMLASSTVQNALVIDPTVAQSGTAGYNMLLINPTESTTGSGSKLLANIQLGGVTKFSVSRTGDTRVGGNILDNNGNIVLNFANIASAVNYIKMVNSATGTEVSIAAAGTDTNVSLSFQPKGTTGLIKFQDNSGNNIMQLLRVASSVNAWNVSPAATGNGPILATTGSDTNIDMNLTPKGTGSIKLNGNVAITDKDIVLSSTTGTKIGTANTQKLSLYGATPIVQPSGTPANATDLATAITLVNDLKAKLIALGAIA